MNTQFALDTINSIEPISRTNLKIEELGSNQVKMAMPISGNTNHKGMMYAGSIFSLAEAAPAVLFLNRYGDGEIAPVCAGINIRFKRPVLSDISLKLDIDTDTFDRLKDEVLDTGKSAVDFQTEIKDSDGLTVATANVKYVLLKT